MVMVRAAGARDLCGVVAEGPVGVELAQARDHDAPVLAHVWRAAASVRDQYS